MRIRLVCLTVAGMASSAVAVAAPSAEDDLATSQLSLGRRADFLDDKQVDPYVRSAAFAQLAGGGDGGGGAAAGASAAIGGIGCDLASVSAQGRLRPLATDNAATGEGTYGVCLSRVLIHVEFAGSRGVGIAPSIADRRSLWSRRYAQAYDTVTIGFGEFWNPGNPHHHEVLAMTLGHGTTTQVDGDAIRTIKTLDFDVVPYRFRDTRGLTVDTLVFTSNALKAGDSDLGGVAGEFLPVRVKLELDDVFVNAAVGWGFSGGQVTASSSTMVDGKTTSSWTETIDAKGLPNMTILVGDVQAGIRQDRVTASAGISRSFYPTFDGNIAREARISAELSYDAGKTRRTKLTLSSFAARTHTWTRDDGDSHDTSRGAQLHVGHELTQQLRVDAVGEVGVSPYARLDGDRLANQLGGQAMVALTGRVKDFTGRLK